MRHTWKTTLILITLTLIFLPNTAHCRVAPGQVQISPVVGIAVPLGGLRDLQRAGYTAGLSIDYMAAERVALGADLYGTHFYGSSRREFDSWYWETFDVSYRYSLAQYGMHLRWYLTPPQSPSPFLEFGAGAVSHYATRTESRRERRVRYETVKAGMGFHYGAGLDLKFTRLASGIVSVTHFLLENPGGGSTSRFWTARFALAFQFRSI